jgi:predicted nucleotidyltransferase
MTTQPPRREGILKVLRDSRPLLEPFGVARLSLFGSFATDEGREDSDVDLLVEFSRPIGLFEFLRLQRQLGERIGRPVELVTPAALKPQLRDRILNEAVIAAQFRRTTMSCLNGLKLRV